MGWQWVAMTHITAISSKLNFDSIVYHFFAGAFWKKENREEENWYICRRSRKADLSFSAISLTHLLSFCEIQSIDLFQQLILFRARLGAYKQATFRCSPVASMTFSNLASMCFHVRFFWGGVYIIQKKKCNEYISFGWFSVLIVQIFAHHFRITFSVNEEKRKLLVTNQ